MEMAHTGIVKSFNPHKGWGFVTTADGQDIFFMRSALKGFCVEKDSQITFDMIQAEKGMQAENISVLSIAGDGSDLAFIGEIKSFNPEKGYGFIAGEAMTGLFGKDCLVLKNELPGGMIPIGGQVKFRVLQGEKGPTATGVQLLGQAGQMSMMGMKGGMGMQGGMGFQMPMGGKGNGALGIRQPMFQKQGKGGPMGDPNDPVCWTFKTKGACKFGDTCKWIHQQDVLV